MPAPTLRALALNCTLKPSPQPSSGDLMASQFLDELQAHGVETSSVRAVDHNIAPGVATDMGDGDDWPTIRAQVLAADVLVFISPTWMGHMSSVAQRVLERLDADNGAEGEDGSPLLYGKVAVVGVVGNEDGAHKVTADVFQALNDVGYTIPAQGGTYWNGEAMQKTDYRDLDETPEAVAAALRGAVSNGVHLARLLAVTPYPT